MAKYASETPSTPSPSRRRLGHPLAAGYDVPSLAAPSPPPQQKADKKRIIRGESVFPVYWVEVLDRAYQKWHPVDPLVTNTQWRPHKLEPPASDKDNCLTYVVAFNPDGSARDVTRRYAKAYNAKTRKMRVDGLGLPRSGGEEEIRKISSGERWWRRVMRYYSLHRGDDYADLDQIELTELAAEEAKEPMPRNVADFKDHPVYALERHLRRNEVLIPGAQSCGTVGAGSKGPLERIYRRRDVRLARSREKWYRLGRVIKPGEEPVKILPKAKRRVNKGRFNDDDEDEKGEGSDDDALFGTVQGTPIYTYEQTDLYVPPPVVNGKVPKNKFGNVDCYVPSMVPPGGVHIPHERAARAAFVLGVDYAPALTGFEFKGGGRGRGVVGTAVLRGVVVPEESAEAVRAVIDGFADLEAELEQERRTKLALKTWRRFLMALRIRERIWAGVDEDEEERDQQRKEREDKGKEVARDEAEEEGMEMEDVEGGGFDVQSDVTEEFDMAEDDEGGGFVIE